MPLYQYHCPPCKKIEDRLTLLVERDAQTCSLCGHPLERMFAPTRSRPVIGSRQRSLAAKSKNLIELGDATPEEVSREMDRWGRESTERRKAELFREATGIVQDLGDDLWIRPSASQRASPEEAA